ncbi:uncharacterized protein HaLaN_16037 [Haematococcus lacustris]|uniref:Uncharacterized protein n=1 Tax=Haematococcus lacustris TaxID=44745 RepID=A0A699ZJD0_HAELA|nr:uncharacterized protein HaLaN_16037 [Haematococcus lacustris]
MDWQHVADELGTGRSAKQCREHYLYSLQPNMIKGQWTQQEEYIIAREHSMSGSQWSRIASCLPGRTDNAVKNTFYAATRSKARNKSYSILWLYAKQLQAGKTPAAALSKAVEVSAHGISVSGGRWQTCAHEQT